MFNRAHRPHWPFAAAIVLPRGTRGFVVGKGVNMPSRPFPEYRDTRAWRVIEASINELMVVGDVSINTATDYAIGFLCHELVRAKLIVSTDSEP